MSSAAYQKGVHAALQKVGFIDLVDAEDLPEVLDETKKRQLYALHRLNLAAGFPAGGLIEQPQSYEL
jgi:hypothetical protein